MSRSRRRRKAKETLRNATVGALAPVTDRLPLLSKTRSKPARRIDSKAVAAGVSAVTAARSAARKLRKGVRSSAAG